MRNIIKTGLGAVLTAGMLFSSCTSDFENINQDDRKIVDSQLAADGFSAGARIMQMQQCLYANLPSQGTNWKFQILQNLNADLWSGYLTPPTPFAGNVHNNVYVLNDGWNSSMWNDAYSFFMPPSLKIERQSSEQKEMLAANTIMRVAMMHKVSDYYGPVIYENYGKEGSDGTYEAQENVYKAFFNNLDEAIKDLTEFHQANPEGKPLEQFDLMFGGDFKQWIKYANSLRLRLAIRVAYVDAALAKTNAEAAVAHEYGVFEGDEKAAMKIGTYTNPLGEIAASWGDIRLGASIATYLVGYDDPRLSKMALPATDADIKGQYIGIRLGCDIKDKDDYVGYSSTAITKTTSPVLLGAAEAWLLRAEGALRGWNMKTTAEEAYKNGIKASMDQWGAAYDETTYLSDKTPIAYVDPNNSANNAAALTSVTPKWDESASNAVKLEKIITQRWIACYPDGTEGWAEVRRSGFPKIFPVVNNKSGGEIPQGEFIKRVRFSVDDKARNPEGYAKGVQLLEGGKDSPNARLWWDVANKSFN